MAEILALVVISKHQVHRKRHDCQRLTQAFVAVAIAAVDQVTRGDQHRRGRPDCTQCLQRSVQSLAVEFTGGVGLEPQVNVGDLRDQHGVPRIG
jgi:hypothetical protein